jgi:alpha-beta hydrolase superfamily lysophospholipase
MQYTRVFVTTDSSVLSLHRYRPASGSPLRSVALVPGYGMNSHILQFHPGGPSLVRTLVDSGLEVWCFDLRGQGDSRAIRDPGNHSIADLAWSDLAACVEHVTTLTNAPLALVGCSLGAAITFAYLAKHPNAPVDRVATLAGLVTWVEVPALVRTLFVSRRLAAHVPIKQTRALARIALPALAKLLPKLLAPYINTVSSDITRSEEMVLTVEDPSPKLNGELADWVHRRELLVGGINVSASLAAFHKPYYCVVAAQDGIVPRATAESIFKEVGSADKQLLVVGTRENPIAHGDLFIGRGMQEAVFQPLARFLNGGASSS